jgi:hypothetical protein
VYYGKLRGMEAHKPSSDNDLTNTNCYKNENKKLQETRYQMGLSKYIPLVKIGVSD